jgi:mono/diheme cytochrome c family protein
VTITRRVLRRGAIAAIVLLGTAGAMLVYDRFFREEPAPYFASDEDHFLFGSIGTESAEGVPYWLWLVLPRVFPDLLKTPGGYASVGFLSKDGHDLPIGLSRVTVGFPRVGINCAACHAASYRTRPDEPPTIVAAAASNQTAPQEYVRFLFNAAADPRFNADTLLGEISRNTRLSFVDRLIYRFAIIPTARRELLRQRDSQEAWMRSRPDWGRGRIDPFNPVKFRILGQPIDDTIGNSDMVPVWALERRNGQAYHWDGLNTTLREVVLSSALGDGSTRQWVDRDMLHWDDPNPRTRSSLRRINDYLLKVPAPKYPYPIDAALARSGEGVWATACAACHGRGGARTGTIIPQDEVGTDRHRMDMWTKAASTAYNAYGEGHSWKFSNFRSTNGYVAMPLDGLWLTGPFLHNGSVPSLADLLEPVAQRPKQFWRGYDVYDTSRVGFVTSGPEAQREGTFLDTVQPGNSNAGHTYGTDLPAASKRALLEYMKTL